MSSSSVAAASSEPSPSSAPRVRLPLFEGPLDLLLHLCRRRAVPPEELPIAEITEQFLAWLDLMQELEVEVAGEFLETAALLCLLKSRELLPPVPGLEEEEEEGDPRELLVARLLEYRRFRDAARGLEELPRLQRDFFVRPALPPPEAEDPTTEVELELGDLLSALRDLLERRRAVPAVHEAPPLPRISLEERMQELVDALAGCRRLTLRESLVRPATRPEIVVTFLALLELARRRWLRLIPAEAEGFLVDRAWEGETPRVETLHAALGEEVAP